MYPYSPGAEATEVGYRGYYERTDVRMPDGSRLAPLPILQFIDKKTRKTFAVLPDFLVRCKRYLACVIESAVSRILEEAGKEAIGMEIDRRLMEAARRHQIIAPLLDPSLSMGAASSGW